MENLFKNKKSSKKTLFLAFAILIVLTSFIYSLLFNTKNFYILHFFICLPVSFILIPLSTFILYPLVICKIINYYKLNNSIIHNANKQYKETNKSKKNKNENINLLLDFILLLQNKAQFIDFISEDLNKYENSNIALAAKVIHKNCKKIINNIFIIDHIMQNKEGTSIKVDSNFDINYINLTGNVVKLPPYTGTIVHRGWKIFFKKNSLLRTDNNKNKYILYPAKINVN